ncbi:DNA translocase FtsK [Amylibacter sp. IMCC11727]|uniref:DNA translocase FtsK n=1 Tax=Amylibacter sp. IMCC11727 TaxID=3039851 RepID=UPI00244E00DE|nr:DNA translocase FtsK [Amylibacter sp. IMCC11727]WGI22210.1 DNA translocase FtsK 4TM domain-containing protein [Amylibacter sp. IMCC11727]
MAYQTRSRDPLLETHMQEAIRKRGRELIGLAMVAVSILFAAMLWSYSPTDPSWSSATSQPAQNMLGAFGAGIASKLILAIGWASWCMPLLLFVWGTRFVLHLGDTRLIGRAVVIPVFLAVSAIFLATHVPPSIWPHGFGLGGLSGDAALGIVMDLVPLSLTIRLIVVSLALGALFIVTGLFTLGFSKLELRYIAHYSLIAIILTYASIVTILGFVARGGAKGALAAKATIDARREANAETQTVETLRGMPEEPATGGKPAEQAPTAKSWSVPKFKLPTLRKDAPASDLDEVIDLTAEDDEEQDRVRNRINDAIKSKVLRARTLRVADEPVVTENIFREQPDFEDPAAPSLGGASRGAEEEQPIPTFMSRHRAPATEQKSVVKPRSQAPVQQSKKAKAEAQPSLFKQPQTDYETPPLELLANPTTIVRHQLSDEALEENARMLESVLDDYGVKGDIVSVRPGPVVTMYELEPAPGLKASRVIGLADDIARSMSALSARVSTVPGKSVIGIELPNENRETVLLRELLASRDYGDGDHGLPLALGKDIGGKSQIANLAKMPHLLIAGTTGSGKSVAINTMILSLLYKLSPEECRMIMIDPKMLELSVYDGIPHLLSPVVTDPKKAVVALKWVVGEMEERYRKMSKMGVRNIGGYNARVEAALAKGEDFTRTVQTGFDDDTGEPVFETETFTPEKMPFIVVIVDEMADLMMVAGKEIEACIQRLAQMARASGIHLIMATQRPSVDVITGTIKANFPTRISFQVTSKIDSRTILGEMGAEQLLGMGDMLYMAGGGKVTRVHAPFASDEEVEEVVNHLKQFGEPEYVSGVVEGPADDKESDIDAVLGLGGNTNGENALYDQAVAIVIKDRKCSTSYIQRKLSIGYNKAAKLVEEMEDQGVVSQANHVGKREILVPEQH